MTTELCLAICGSRAASDVFPVRPGENVVGRTHRCDVRLDHRTVSRRHAVLAVAGSHISVRDLGSTNGTFVNGKRVQSGKVTARDSLRFGDVVLDVLDRPPSGYVAPDECDETPTRMESGSDDFTRLERRLSGPRRRVLRLLLTGITEKEVAGRLDMRENTVHWHAKHIYAESGVHSRAELVACSRTLAER